MVSTGAGLSGDWGARARAEQSATDPWLGMVSAGLYGDVAASLKFHVAAAIVLPESPTLTSTSAPP